MIIYEEFYIFDSSAEKEAEECESEASWKTSNVVSMERVQRHLWQRLEDKNTRMQYHQPKQVCFWAIRHKKVQSGEKLQKTRR